MAEFDPTLKRDLETQYIKVNVSNVLNYNSKFSFSGVTFNISCGYNSRNLKRWIILTSDNGDVLLPQTFLKYGRRCELNFMSELYNLKYYVTLRPKDATKLFSDDYDYREWQKDFDLCFVGIPYSVKERLDIGIRRYLVGN